RTWVTSRDSVAGMKRLEAESAGSSLSTLRRPDATFLSVYAKFEACRQLRTACFSYQQNWL
ncbi:MAG: hypothetical protein L7W43_12590, partial [Rubripirellula sp.]|nr:hypothetical protein [Rubripirellula sp.]